MLLKLDYFPEKFDPILGSKLTQPNTLNFSLASLMWSSITVGRDSWNKVVQSGMYSAFEIIYRSSLLLANLEVGINKKLLQSDVYINLDMSEKSAISYFIGLTSTKLLAQKLFGVNWLMHLDVYRNLLKPQFLLSRSRPDLIGLNKAKEWFAFEAKGRTGRVDAKTKVDAKKQVEQLKIINGKIVSLHIALISYFNARYELEVYLKDPPIEEGLSLDMGHDAFLFDYYRLFTDFIKSDYGDRSSITHNNHRYFVKYVREIDSYVGIDEEVYDLAQEKRNRRMLERVVFSLPENSIESDDPTAPFIGSDGIYIAVGQQWASRFVKHN